MSAVILAFVQRQLPELLQVWQLGDTGIWVVPVVDDTSSKTTFPYVRLAVSNPFGRNLRKNELPISPGKVVEKIELYAHELTKHFLPALGRSRIGARWRLQRCWIATNGVVEIEFEIYDPNMNHLNLRAA